MRFWKWIGRRIVLWAWLSVILQVVLIGTGGAVRLTASGLGCPTWPTCTTSSFVPTPQLGIYGIIEFSNRMLTFVLSVVAILAFLAAIQWMKQRRDLFVLTLLQGIFIVFQAVIGGLAVLTKLSPQIVGVHFALSSVLVVITTMLVWRAVRGRPGLSAPPRTLLVLAWIDAVFVAVTVALGILTTGSGPHAGDALTAEGLAPRNGLNSEVIQTVHSIPAYVTFAFAILFVVVALVASDRDGWKIPRRVAFGMLGVEVLQIAVGLIQANTGLPIALVNIHMVLAGLLVAVITAFILSIGRLQITGSSAGTFAKD